MKAVIFDLDGVLVDTEVAYIDQFKGFMENEGYYFEDEIYFSMVGTSNDTTYPTLKSQCDSFMEEEQFHARFHEYCINHPVDYIKLLNPNAREILEYLKQAGYKTALASSSYYNKILEKLTVNQLLPYFEVVMSGEFFKESKPNPEIYLHTAELLGIQPQDCLVIEDSFYGITAGKRAGMTVAAKEEKRFKQDQSHADFMIHDLIEIQDILEKAAA